MHKRSTALERSVKILIGLYLFNGNNLTLSSDVWERDKTEENTTHKTAKTSALPKQVTRRQQGRKQM